MSAVKGRQAEKSRQTQRRVLAAAHDLFVANGYGRTALQDVADRAGVAVQTIYFLFRTKRNLLKRVVDVTVAGDDEPVATLDRPWFTEAVAAPTAGAHLRVYIDGSSGALERAAAVAEVLRMAAACVEPELDQEWRQAEANRYRVQHAAAEHLLGKPGARAGLTADQAADLLFAVLSPDLYLLLRRDRGWTTGQYREWAYRVLAVDLLEPVSR